MPLFWLILVVLAIAAVGYVLGRSRALSSAGGELSALHSLPSYYGANVAMKVVVPAFLLLIVWLLAQPFYVNNVISGMIPETSIEEGSSRG
ncbi:MAG: phosphate ABC transporter permease family protein, partial [Pseudomonadota bacterium]